MTTEQLLNNAIDYIYELTYQDSWVCDKLLKIPEEEKICAAYCQNLCKDCIIRFLKHYKKLENG